jgi:putative spermidine/putrescine transport system substrate-binding protein
MKHGRRRYLLQVALALLTVTLAVAAAGCGGGGSGGEKAGKGGSSGLPSSIGEGEGRLNLVAWTGYAQPQWVKPFQQQTGCQVRAKYANTSDEMVTLMRQGGGTQYDMVSASGDASLRLIRGEDVRAVNPDLIPDYDNFIEELKSPAHNTVDGKHYGISLQWGPNTLLYNTTAVKPKPTTWSVIYGSKYKGRVTVPDNPIQIADAALYLSKTKPDLGIKDPYELTEEQLNATVDLLKQQRPVIKKYWASAADEIELFKNGDVVIGAAWPYQTNTLVADKAPVAETIPKEGATGWADTWMLAKKSKHVNCAYKWMAWVSTPKVQAQQAIYFGETPANKKACKVMDQLSKGSCAQYHADATASYFKQIKFWKTPSRDCGDGKTNCVDYTRWQQAWTEIKG